METLTHNNRNLYTSPMQDQQLDSTFPHELIDYHPHQHTNHHLSVDPNEFEDEYDSYNSDFDLDTK